MEHTPEPWFFGHDPVSDFYVRGTPEEGISLYLGQHMNMADARRIVACVNACAGLPTDVLDQMAGIAKLAQDKFPAADAEAGG